ncbi:toxin [Pseudomonas sp. B2M1-30]|uniref:RHS repeat-associated core domain-containing protein n=1 Tax=Pseudomonas TaxID=286 RepID=UPI0021CAE111|nr:toxin [Pseudomonas sp. B2M1-30]MCU7263249.1 toxin [Pseudomonas koreensis]
MPGSVHLRTPAVIANDSRGLAVRHIAYLRTVAGDAAQPLVSRQQHDPAGRLVVQQDPRLSTPNITTLYALDGQPLRIDNVDAGPLLVLPGLAGQELQRWDARGNHWRATYDEQIRAVAIEENGVADIETSTYADASADAGRNLRGRLIALSDPSGQVSFDGFALVLPDQPLRESRTFGDAMALVSHRTFSALGTPLEQIDAAGHRQQSTYDVAGQLNQVRLQLNGQTTWQAIQQQAQYNAAGQLVEQLTGNNLTCRWCYDPADGRLLQQTAHKDSGAVVQDLGYEYDPVGNVTAIFDHAFIPRFFANQRIDGHRAFSYDSLYRLIRATGHADAAPSDNPGRPQPTDPNDRRNYVETYVYDSSNNLIKTTHVRDGASHTHEMFIDPASNRGVRRQRGEPPPDFDSLFDRAGNLLALQPGQPLRWDNRGRLQSVTLIDRGNGPDDQETCRYSQGERVGKRHESHTPKASHFHDVRYLPGLEIRTRDTGEELHVISIGMAAGGARCLHWEKDPANVGADQWRYTLSDHLDSAVKELDGQANLISDEGYRPFGATACLTARSAVEVSYRTLRYSNREMDDSGLYFYGARYYAPWLGRWISADPAGDADGLNLYAFVGGNPIGNIDANGEGRLPTTADFNAGLHRIIQSQNESYARHRQLAGTRHAKENLSREMTRHIEILGLTKRRVVDAQGQLDRMGSGSGVALAAARRTATLVIGKGISYGVGVAVGVGAQALGAAAPGIGNVVGVGLGIGAKVAVSGLVDYLAERSGLSATVNLKTSRLTANKIIQKAEYKQMEPLEYLVAKYRNMKPDSRKAQLKLSKEAATQSAGYLLKSTLPAMPSEAMGAISSSIAALIGLPEIIDETFGALSDKSGEKMQMFEQQITGLINEIETNQARVHAFADALSLNSISGIDIDDLDQQTSAITHLLHGLGQRVRNHRANQGTPV